MSHPYQNLRQSKVEKNRVASMTSGYPGAAGVTSAAKRPVKSSAKAAATAKIEGKSSAPRLDKFARGGKVKGKGSTNVNVIIAPQGGGGPGAMPKPMMPPPGGPMPAPPMAGPPGMPPGAGGPPMPPGMMPHARGGRAYANGGSVGQKKQLGTPTLSSGYAPISGNIKGSSDSATYQKIQNAAGRAPPDPSKNNPYGQKNGGRANYAKGGKVKSGNGPAWAEGLKNGTQVQHTDGKDDQAGLGRGKPVTYAKGGGVTSVMGRGVNSATAGWKSPSSMRTPTAAPMPKMPKVKMGKTKFATGGPVEAGTSMGPHLTAGDNGIGRLEKSRIQRLGKYAHPSKNSH